MLTPSAVKPGSAAAMASISEEKDVAETAQSNFMQVTLSSFKPPQRAIYDRLLADREADIAAATCNLPAFWEAPGKRG